MIDWRKCKILALLAMLCPMMAGCVERKMTIRSDPPDATVVLNGREVGKTPYEGTFQFYGTYSVVLAAPDCERLKTTAKLTPPLYERPVIDLFFECFWPMYLFDEHEFSYTLKPVTPLEEMPSEEMSGLLERADALRASVKEFGGAATEAKPAGSTATPDQNGEQK
jgi:hypothetical protein